MSITECHLLPGSVPRLGASRSADDAAAPVPGRLAVVHASWVAVAARLNLGPRTAKLMALSMADWKPGNVPRLTAEGMARMARTCPNTNLCTCYQFKINMTNVFPQATRH